MRWNSLFRDLELEFQGLERADEAIEVREQTRTQVAQISLSDRLRASIESEVEIMVAGGGSHRGVLKYAYPHWILLADQTREILIAANSIVAVSGLQNRAALPTGPSARRLSLAHVLRALARDRSAVTLETWGEEFHGIFSNVGRDWVQLQLQRPGEIRLIGTEVTIAQQAIRVVHNRKI